MLNQLIVYLDRTISIGLRPKGKGTQYRQFDHNGVLVYFGSYTDEIKYAASRLPASEGRPQVDVVASKYVHELYEILTSKKNPDAQREAIRDVAWEAIKDHFSNAQGGIILAMLCELWDRSYKDGADFGERCLKVKFHKLLEV